MRTRHGKGLSVDFAGRTRVAVSPGTALAYVSGHCARRGGRAGLPTGTRTWRVAPSGDACRASRAQHVAAWLFFWARGRFFFCLFELGFLYLTMCLRRRFLNWKAAHTARQHTTVRSVSRTDTCLHHKITRKKSMLCSCCRPRIACSES
ncbi:hypothetical protein PVAP13_3NG258135 [Panicum virgatum]|uniref:Uncharacterized protein n=1 Tax=Panicum virgatum TaxID=38727 RepID=A0A8T0UAG4_PANVG|nr:hypothetical protein PVAP13_3NG258135 [Panicum virgatum]